MNSYAGFWIRTKAFLLDYLIILVYLIVLTLIFLLINQASDISRSLFASRISAQISGFLLVTVPISLYFAIGESSVHRGTWGKRRLHLAVAAAQGRRQGADGTLPSAAVVVNTSSRRVRRSRPGRVQISPQTHRVIRSWNPRVKSLARASARSTCASPRMWRLAASPAAEASESQGRESPAARV